ncbi:MAG TPA: class I SAM-dependent methyltransferase [Candidatus Methanomethylophilaceae archaeon]|nr:class I SAM-dependent methyltransferase [Candidatus Methanomethylophilaceae archaeon]
MNRPGKTAFSMPTGEMGKKTMEEMNIHHRDLTVWALSLIKDGNYNKIMDVGCGGGLAINLMGHIWPSASLTGVDISPDALEYCASTVDSDVIKRLELCLSSVTELPFPDGTFDLVTSFESYFFWDDVQKGLEEICRCLRPNGTVMIVSEAYPHPAFNERNKENARIHGMKLLHPDEIVRILEGNGADAKAILWEEKNWMAVIGSKLSCQDTKENIKL